MSSLEAVSLVNEVLGDLSLWLIALSCLYGIPYCLYLHLSGWTQSWSGEFVPSFFDFLDSVADSSETVAMHSRSHLQLKIPFTVSTSTTPTIVEHVKVQRDSNDGGTELAIAALFNRSFQIPRLAFVYQTASNQSSYKSARVVVNETSVLIETTPLKSSTATVESIIHL